MRFSLHVCVALVLRSTYLTPSNFTEAPFTACHGTVSIGDVDGGVIGNCVTDVCNCDLDQSCGCSQLDSYAYTCIDRGIDLTNWREDVAYCREFKFHNPI